MGKIVRKAENPDHVLIKALKKKGYTGIKLSWNTAMYQMRGWVLECDQIQWRRLGGDIDHSKKIIRDNIPFIQPSGK